MVSQIRPLVGGDRAKSGGRWKIFTDFHSCFICIIVSDLALGGQIIHQSIRLHELNLLQFTAKLCMQRFGGKFKKMRLSGEERQYVKKINLGL